VLKPANVKASGVTVIECAPSANAAYASEVESSATAADGPEDPEPPHALNDNAATRREAMALIGVTGAFQAIRFKAN
jgi:hypothetical protein